MAIKNMYNPDSDQYHFIDKRRLENPAEGCDIETKQRKME